MEWPWFTACVPMPLGLSAKALESKHQKCSVFEVRDENALWHLL